jgi:putative ABC transport system ATP-binding protein
MLLEIKNLSKEYLCSKSGQKVAVLKDINLTINSAEKIAITGLSGSGKSTLLNILGLLDRPDSGSYFWKWENVLELDKNAQADFRRQHIGFVFQNFGLLPGYTVLENLLQAMKYSEIGLNDRQKLAHSLLEKVGLAERRNHLPRELSGGQCQRLGLARALYNRPRLLLADEPTGNLDRQNTAQILKLFEDFHQDSGTLIIVTHNQEVASFCEKKYVLENGTLAFCG